MGLQGCSRSDCGNTNGTKELIYAVMRVQGDNG